MEFQKPIPLKTIDNHPYWDAADRHELAVQKCETCSAYNHPPGPSCAKCGSEEVVWEKLGSEIEGSVYSYIVSYRPFLPGFQDDLPLIIAQVELNQYPEIKIMANILECGPEEVQIGMPVQMTWIDINEERAIPQWKPANN